MRSNALLSNINARCRRMILATLIVGLSASSAAAAAERVSAPQSISRGDLRSLAMRIAAEEGVPPVLFDELVRAESNYQIGAVSTKGAMSLAQLMPATARAIGLTEDDFFDPEANLRGGARYLRQQLDAAGDVVVALGAYNAGMARVENREFGEWPRETRNYVSRILSRVASRTAKPRLVGSIVSMARTIGPGVESKGTSADPADTPNPDSSTNLVEADPKTSPAGARGIAELGSPEGDLLVDLRSMINLAEREGA